MPMTIKGQPIDQLTDVALLPLPHLDNWLEDDVPRLRLAFELIDAALQLMGLELDSKAQSSELQALALSLSGKANATDVASAMEQKADAVTTLEALAGKASTAAVAILAEDAARPASAVYSFVNARIAEITEMVDGAQVVTSIAYNENGSFSSVTRPVADGKTRTETYTYESGRLTGMAATEVQT